jgi:hypothetical protein
VGLPLGERVALLPVRHPQPGGPGRLLLLGGLLVEFGKGAVQLGLVSLPVVVGVGALQLAQRAGAGAVADRPGRLARILGAGLGEVLGVEGGIFTPAYSVSKRTGSDGARTSTPWRLLPAESSTAARRRRCGVA